MHQSGTSASGRTTSDAGPDGKCGLCHRCPFNRTYPNCDIDCVEYIDKMIELEGGSNKVAAVIVEPVVGSNGIIPPPAEYLLREENIYIPADTFGIWIVPPLIVEKQEIDFIVDSIDEALQIADDEVTA